MLEGAISYIRSELINKMVAIDWYSVSVAAFVITLAVIVWRDRKKFTRQTIVLLRRTKWGRKFLVRVGQGWSGWLWVGNVAIVLGFAASIWVVWQFLYITIRNLTAEQAIPAAGFILPSPFATPAAGPGYFAIPFWHWIVAIALLALAHEGLHGIMAAREKVDIKSLGWGILLVIPLAFVEPDEKQLAKRSIRSQLRVLAAGSFANFCLAGLALLSLLAFTFGLFVPSGVAFQGWPAVRVSSDDVLMIDNISLSEFDLSSLNESGLVELRTASTTYVATRKMLMAQLNRSEWTVFEDWPAVRANLTGTIIQIENRTITSTADLEMVLEEFGPNQTISVVTSNGTENKTFIITTAAEPLPDFSPDWGTRLLLVFEQIVPGMIEFSQMVSKGWESLWAQYREDWRSINNEIAFWKWVGQDYPILNKKAQQKISQLEAKLSTHPRAGFIGIAGVHTILSVKSELAAWSEVITFIQGLLFWIFLINFGVGAFNLLPIRALDGGRMWELILRKTFPKHAKQMMGMISSLVIFLILLNFLSIFGLV